MIDKVHTPKNHDGMNRSKPTKFNSFKDLNNLSAITQETSKDSNGQIESELCMAEYMKPHMQCLHQLDYTKLQEELPSKIVYLVSPPSKPLLILDLDETIIFNGLRNEENPYDYIAIRPFADDFFELVSTVYEIWVWTASEMEYANYALSMLDPHSKYIKAVIAQESCTQVGNMLVKDLRIFANLDLAKVVMIDNLLVSFAATLNNGILISPFLNNSEDHELEMLSAFLVNMSGCSDFREMIKTTFNYAQYS